MNYPIIIIAGTLALLAAFNAGRYETRTRLASELPQCAWIGANGATLYEFARVKD